MKIQFSRIFALTALTILLVVPVFVFTASSSHAAQNIVDGDLVTVSPNPDIYIVKIIGVKKFKRLILNPDIFNSYGHLKWSNVKTIDQVTLDSYKLSELVIEVNADESVADPKVYRVVSSENSDVGERSWLNLTASEFEAAGYDWDSLYKVNHKEALPSFYPTKTPLTYQDVLSIKATIMPAAIIAPIVTTPPTQNTEASSQRYLTTEGGAVYDTVLKKFISSTPSSQVATTTQSSTIVVGSINLSASPATISADGKSTSIITARVKDVSNNAVSNQTVYFSYENTTMASVTDTNGIATAIYIADTNASVVSITASTDGVKNNTQVTKIGKTTLKFSEGGGGGSNEGLGFRIADFGFTSDKREGEGEYIKITKLVLYELNDVLGNYYDFILTDDKYNVISKVSSVVNPLIFDISINPIVITNEPSCFPQCVRGQQMVYVWAKSAESLNKTSKLSIQSIEAIGLTTGVKIEYLPR